MSKPIDPANYRSICPIARTLDVFGDRWTLLVIRDLILGKHRYGDLQASPEHIPTNLLADRLKSLELAGIITKVAYQERPVRYEYHLSEAGMALVPVIRAMREWAVRYLPGTYSDDFLRHF